MRWMDIIRTWTGLAMNELLRLVANRQGWRNVVQKAFPTLGWRMNKKRTEQNLSPFG